MWQNCMENIRTCQSYWALPGSESASSKCKSIYNIIARFPSQAHSSNTCSYVEASTVNCLM